MRVFEHPNMGGDWKCPICQKGTDSPVVLVAISGTEEGNIVQAEQVHVDCLSLKWFRKENIIAQNLKEVL